MHVLICFNITIIKLCKVKLCYLSFENSPFMVSWNYCNKQSADFRGLAFHALSYDRTYTLKRENIKNIHSQNWVPHYIIFLFYFDTTYNKKLLKPLLQQSQWTTSLSVFKNFFPSIHFDIRSLLAILTETIATFHSSTQKYTKLQFASTLLLPSFLSIFWPPACNKWELRVGNFSVTKGEFSGKSLD